jgi:hypothetical protein
MKKNNQCYFAHLTAALIVAALALTDSTYATAQNVAVASGVGPAGAGVAATVEMQAHVMAIDPVSNSVTLRGPQGRVLDVVVNPDVGDVSKLRLGDAVNIEYQGALLIHADKVKSNGIRERIDQTATTPASQGVTATVHRILVLATIEKVDVKKRQVTLRGPTQTVVVQAGPDVPLGGLMVGDSVRAEVVTAMAVQITRDGASLK